MDWVIWIVYACLLSCSEFLPPEEVWFKFTSPAWLAKLDQNVQTVAKVFSVERSTTCGPKVRRCDVKAFIEEAVLSKLASRQVMRCQTDARIAFLVYSDMKPHYRAIGHGVINSWKSRPPRRFPRHYCNNL